MNLFGPHSPRRLLLGFLLTPWVIALLCLVDIFVMGHAPHGAYEWSITVLFLWCLVLPTAYVALFGLGWPALALLRRWGGLSWGPVLLAGLLTGVLALYVLSVLLSGFHQWTWPGLKVLIMKGGLLGLEAGFAFCLIAGLPMRSARAPTPSVGSPESDFVPGGQAQ